MIQNLMESSHVQCIFVAMLWVGLRSANHHLPPGLPAVLGQDPLFQTAGVEDVGTLG